MAKRKVNRSQAIREYSEANPNEKPKEISVALKAKGIKVSPQYISTILTKVRSGPRKKRGRKAGANGSTSGIEELMLAKKLVQQVGLERAQEAIKNFGKLMA